MWDIDREGKELGQVGLKDTNYRPNAVHSRANHNQGPVNRSSLQTVKIINFSHVASNE